MNKYYPHLKEHILPILEKMDIAYSTLDKNKIIVEYVKTLNNISLDDIKIELIDYINNSITKEKVKKNTRKI